MKKSFIINICLILIFSFAANGQSDPSQQEKKEKQETANIVATGRYIDNKIELRWYPMDGAYWQKGNKNGYEIQRLELTEEGTKEGWKNITPTPIKPYSLQEWETRTDINNDFNKLASHALYKEELKPTKKNASWEELSDYNERLDDLHWLFTLATNQNAETSLAAGQRFEDNTIQEGKPYAYKITINGLQKTSELDTALVMIENTKTPYKAPTVQDVRIMQEESKVVILWNAQVNDPLFPLYNIERSTDGKNFKKVNELPILIAADLEENFYKDKVENDQPYFYRVVGLTPFGDFGTPSEVVKGMGVDKTPAMGATNIKAKGNRKSISVSWELLLQSKDLEGFYIGRGVDVDGPFEYLNSKPLSPSTRNFVDNNPHVLYSYYVVHAIDKTGNISPATGVLASIDDNEAPLPPLNLQGEVDTNGVVTIKWERGKELDLMGYHIFQANGRDDVYKILTPHAINLTEFTDTVTMIALNREIYYKITALDFNNNPSPYSEILVLKRPDIIPPNEALIHTYNVGKEEVKLDWHNSSSIDVKEHILKRKKEGEREATEILRFNDNTKTYTDKDVEIGASYEYTLEAVDHSNLKSTSTPLIISIYNHGERSGVERLNVVYDPISQKAKLTWTYADKNPDCRFLIFRSKDEAPLLTHSSVDSNTLVYEESIEKEAAYQYSIKVIFADGSESELSKSVRLVND